MERKQRVFVYGTLKNGQFFHDEFLGNGQSDFKGPARTTDEYSLYVGAAPHMIREKSERGVKGELYEVDGPTLARLDRLEAHPVVYRREIVDVISETGERVLAWAYLRHPNFKDKSQCYKEDEFV